MSESTPSSSSSHDGSAAALAKGPIRSVKVAPGDLEVALLADLRRVEGGVAVNAAGPLALVVGDVLVPHGDLAVEADLGRQPAVAVHAAGAIVVHVGVVLPLYSLSAEGAASRRVCQLVAGRASRAVVPHVVGGEVSAAVDAAEGDVALVCHLLCLLQRRWVQGDGRQLSPRSADGDPEGALDPRSPAGCDQVVLPARFHREPAAALPLAAVKDLPGFGARLPRRDVDDG
mmetsp:Transcript_5996/g.13862  ORF Transcript_5996/g.13862 Transcript_5996/m.13862 type:complete len:230 (-) Transcript_5996:1934-2623(-)